MRRAHPTNVRTLSSSRRRPRTINKLVILLLILILVLRYIVQETTPKGRRRTVIRQILLQHKVQRLRRRHHIKVRRRCHVVMRKIWRMEGRRADIRGANVVRVQDVVHDGRVVATEAVERNQTLTHGRVVVEVAHGAAGTR